MLAAATPRQECHAISRPEPQFLVAALTEHFLKVWLSQQDYRECPTKSKCHYFAIKLSFFVILLLTYHASYFLHFFQALITKCSHKFPLAWRTSIEQLLDITFK